MLQNAINSHTLVLSRFCLIPQNQCDQGHITLSFGSDTPCTQFVKLGLCISRFFLSNLLHSLNVSIKIENDGGPSFDPYRTPHPSIFSWGKYYFSPCVQLQIKKGTNKIHNRDLFKLKTLFPKSRERLSSS